MTGKRRYVVRDYRRLTKDSDLTYFSVIEKESDLYIGSNCDLSREH